MEIPIDKIKVNNAVVVFMILITCVCCPLSLLIEIDYKIFFNNDLTKILIATISIGFTQFGIIYVGNSLGMRVKTYKDEGPIAPQMVNYLLQNPLINTSLILIILYGIGIVTSHLFKLDINGIINMAIYLNSGIVFATLIDLIIFNRRKKK